MEQRLRILRKALGLTITEFGEKIGFSRTGLAELEHGRNAVQERHIRLICAAFPRVNAEWLRGGDGPMFLDEDPDLEAVLAELTVPEAVKTYIRMYDAQPRRIQLVLDKALRDYLARLVPTRQDDDARIEEEAERVAEMYRDEAAEEKRDAAASTGTR